MNNLQENSLGKIVDWSSIDVEITERDGCKIYGFARSGCTKDGRDLTDDELIELEEYQEFQEILFDWSCGE